MTDMRLLFWKLFSDNAQGLMMGAIAWDTAKSSLYINTTQDPCLFCFALFCPSFFSTLTQHREQMKIRWSGRALEKSLAMGLDAS